ncbi:dual specificity protein phosphatase family protein [uncultured Gilliamella sp.]|uniref:dual specificity protein phosphatase family protein n=1 Tax=uncultured Gilliamella sp. TaxID=1193505 RepID=UPI0025D8C7E5|nr:dual specificity protein phosphatase family protein [uncultured Gilliamella sp.]
MQHTTQQLKPYHYDKVATIASFLLLCMLLLISSCQSQINPNVDNMLPDNFHKISSDVYRSEQPSLKQMQYLDKLGFKTVVNLRLWHSDQDEIKDTGISEVWIKLRAGKITDEKMIEILKTIDKSPKPVLIHCWHGSDRTGVTIALYRLVFQNWTKEQAINELMTPEFGHHYNVYPNIVKYIENVDIEKIKIAVFE